MTELATRGRGRPSEGREDCETIRLYMKPAARSYAKAQARKEGLSVSMWVEMRILEHQKNSASQESAGLDN